MQHDAKYPLTSKNRPPILPPWKRKFLSINSILYSHREKGSSYQFNGKRLAWKRKESKERRLVALERPKK